MFSKFVFIQALHYDNVLTWYEQSIYFKRRITLITEHFNASICIDYNFCVFLQLVPYSLSFGTEIAY